jgi:hypothetical protein
MKRILVPAVLAVATSAHATTFSSDFSDLWWNASESGWGANVIQQDNVLFMTFFVYGPGGNPVWYVAPATENTAPSGFVFTGPLYQTNGPWFGGAFNPNSVSVRQAGTATFTGLDINAATLSYNADGVSVTKSLSRQTWRSDNLTGSYIGAFVGTYTGCPGFSGYAEEPAYITISHSGAAMLITAQFTNSGDVCTYSGNYAQAGRMGASSGNVSCKSGGSGTYSAVEVEGTITSFAGRASAVFGGTCRWSGRFGGLFRGS